jgi:hypothetical protein
MYRTNITTMTGLLKLRNIAAGLIALLACFSCSFDSEFDTRTCDAFLTCYYAGGIPSVTTQNSFVIEDHLTDHDIEEIFNYLSANVKPGFTSARLVIDFYDWLDNYDYTRLYDFWWEYTNIHTGDGYYAWDEVKDR